jgi:hypothetical protein
MGVDAVASGFDGLPGIVTPSEVGWNYWNGAVGSGTSPAPLAAFLQHYN